MLVPVKEEHHNIMKRMYSIWGLGLLLSSGLIYSGCGSKEETATDRKQKSDDQAEQHQPARRA